MPADLQGLATEVVWLVKAALAPVVVEMRSLQTQIASLETRWQDHGAVRERLAVLESKGVVIDMAPDDSLVDLRARVVETKQQADHLAAELVTARERLAVLETREPVPGPPGVGKDGLDGLGFDDFEELYDGERTFTHRYRQGDRVKEFVHKTAIALHRGVYLEGKTYDVGDMVTWGGSTWHCSETTTSKPGEGSKGWTLAVKRGRDGKDGRDGGQGPEGKAGKNWNEK
jgi:hypothetical protein